LLLENYEKLKRPIWIMETSKKKYDVIVVGGSYSGLAAGMALGRSLKHTLIIDSGLPCNRQTPHSHNFITHDGRAPKEIATLARQQVEKYDTVAFFNGLAVTGSKTEKGFDIRTGSGETFSATKLIFATGIKDIMPDIPGFAECWGISAIHCPYCHGYEVRNETTGILANGEPALEYAGMISNWTKDLTLFTNGKSTLTPEQEQKIRRHNIKIVEKEITRLDHTGGILKNIVFKDGSTSSAKAVYFRAPFVQHCPIPEALGCELTEQGFIKVDQVQKTTVPGIFACGDNATGMRTVANAVSMGATAGMMANKEMIMEKFD
jgi:thioredoxin reductase